MTFRGLCKYLQLPSAFSPSILWSCLTLDFLKLCSIIIWRDYFEGHFLRAVYPQFHGSSLRSAPRGPVQSPRVPACPASPQTQSVIKKNLMYSIEMLKYAQTDEIHASGFRWVQWIITNRFRSFVAPGHIHVLHVPAFILFVSLLPQESEDFTALCHHPQRPCLHPPHPVAEPQAESCVTNSVREEELQPSLFPPITHNPTECHVVLRSWKPQCASMLVCQTFWQIYFVIFVYYNKQRLLFSW